MYVSSRSCQLHVNNSFLQLCNRSACSSIWGVMVSGGSHAVACMMAWGSYLKEFWFLLQTQQASCAFVCLTLLASVLNYYFLKIKSLLNVLKYHRTRDSHHFYFLNWCCRMLKLVGSSPPWKELKGRQIPPDLEETSQLTLHGSVRGVLRQLSGRWDGSPSKGACSQSWWPKFHAWNPHGGKTTNSCKLSCDLHTYVQACGSLSPETSE